MRVGNKHYPLLDKHICLIMSSTGAPKSGPRELAKNVRQYEEDQQRQYYDSSGLLHSTFFALSRRNGQFSDRNKKATPVMDMALYSDLVIERREYLLFILPNQHNRPERTRLETRDYNSSREEV